MPEREVDPDAGALDQVLWEAWKTMELPEGYRAEIVEGVLEVQRIGRVRHGSIANRLGEALSRYECKGEYGAYHGMAVTLRRRRVWMPDVVVAAQGPGASADEDGIGVVASAAYLVAEVVSQGERHQERDRVRKRREYARAGIPVYVTIPEGPAKGFVIGEAITGPKRS